MTHPRLCSLRLEAAKAPYLANDNIADHLLPGEIKQLQAEVQEKVEAMLQSLVIDTKHDHNTKGTAERVSRMYIQEVFKGRYRNPPTITDFPNFKDLDEIYSVGPITVRSACSHHLVPILGKCWIGIHPGQRVIGLSKFNRLCEWVFSRPHIQEEAVMILADQIEELVAPKGLMVIVQVRALIPAESERWTEHTLRLSPHCALSEAWRYAASAHRWPPEHSTCE